MVSRFDRAAKQNPLALTSARFLLFAVIVFVLLTAGPALWWRYRFGVWMSG